MRRYKYPSMQKQLSKCEKVFALCNEESISSGTIFSMPISTKLIHFLFKLIKNRRAWRIVPENAVERKNKLRVSMTGYPCERQPPSTVTLKKQWKQMILTIYLPWRQGELWVGEKLTVRRSIQQQETKAWDPKLSYKIKVPLHKYPKHQTQHPEIDYWPAILIHLNSI